VIVVALTNENTHLARVGHQTARQTAESIAGTELGQSTASYILYTVEAVVGA